MAFEARRRPGEGSLFQAFQPSYEGGAGDNRFLRMSREELVDYLRKTDNVEGTPRKVWTKEEVAAAILLGVIPISIAAAQFLQGIR